MATISQLKLKPFLSRTEEDKKRIFFAGKPRPELTVVIPSIEKTSSVTINKFDATIYDREPWITGCESCQSLFCWPCLLFVQEKSEWNSSNGFRDFKSLKKGIILHKKTSSHVEGMLSYQLYHHRHARSVNTELVPVLVPQEDMLIARNREATKRIIDVVCYMVTLQYPPRKGSIPKQLQVDDCIDILLSLKPHDSLDLTADSVELLKKYPKFLTEIVSAIAGAVREAIKKEIKKSTYVSLILSEHSTITSKSQLSTVLRFVKDGKVYERFLCFTNLNNYKNADIIFKYISSVIKNYDLSERLASYSCDGAVLGSTFHLNSLKTCLRVNLPYCLFVPCYYHELDFILEQSLSHIKECCILFNNVNSVKSFFHKNSKACEELNVFLNGSVLGLESDDWSNSQFLRVLRTHRKQFILFFESVVNNPEEWDSEDYVSALALQKILQEFDMIFLLQAFSKIFESTCRLSFMLSSLSPESAFGTSMAEELKLSLEKERGENAFEQFWVTIVAEVLEAQEPKPLSLKKAMEHENKMLYRELYIKIIDCVVREIDCRYSCLRGLAFFQILSYEKHGKFVFNEVLLQSLMAVHGPYFDSVVMKNEIMVLCRNSSLFANKTLHGLMEFFVSSDLKDTFKNLFKLAELTLTMPCKPASIVPGRCKFDKIRDWATGVEDPEMPQDLSFLCVEEELMLNLKENPNFIYDVFGMLQQQSKTDLLVYVVVPE